MYLKVFHGSKFLFYDCRVQLDNGVAMEHCRIFADDETSQVTIKNQYH